MKYKKGDRVLLEATVVGVNEAEEFEYSIDINLGNGEYGDDYACTEEAIVTTWECYPSTSPYVTGKCSCFHQEYGKDVCYGTKERDACDCEGNESKCTFYPEKRITSANNNKSDFTYYNTLEELHKLDYYVILEMFGFDESDRFKNREELIGQIVYQYNMAETISIYEHYINYSVVKEGDVITYFPNGKLYLITKIEHNTYHMISDDMTTKSIEYKNGGKMPLKEFTKMESDVTINKFFNK